jgi:hypothetical protein
MQIAARNAPDNISSAEADWQPDIVKKLLPDWIVYTQNWI